MRKRNILLMSCLLLCSIFSTFFNVGVLEAAEKILYTKGVVTSLEEGRFRIQGEGDVKDVILNISPKFYFVDGSKMTVLPQSDFLLGENITAFYGAQLTRSIPPQGTALAAVITENNLQSYYLQVASIKLQAESVEVVDTTGNLTATIAKDVLPMAEAIKAGDILIVWLDPTQTTPIITKSEPIISNQAASQAPPKASAEPIKEEKTVPFMERFSNKPVVSNKPTLPKNKWSASNGGESSNLAGNKAISEPHIGNTPGWGEEKIQIVAAKALVLNRTLYDIRIFTQAGVAVVNGQELNLAKGELEINNSDIYVAVRPLATKLGYNVKWNSMEQRVELHKNGEIVSFKVGTDDYKKNEEIINVGKNPKLVGDKTLVPVEFFEQVLGKNVEISNSHV